MRVCQEWNALNIPHSKKTKKSKNDEEDDVDADVDLIEWNGIEVNAYRAVTRNEEMVSIKKILLDFIDLKRREQKKVHFISNEFEIHISYLEAGYGGGLTACFAIGILIT